MHRDLQEILVTHEQIVQRCKELAHEFDQLFHGEVPILLCLLKGSVPFMAELMKHMKTPLQTEYMIVSSYHGGVKSSGEIRIIKDIDISIRGRHVLIVEDIIDSGATLDRVVALLENRGARVTIVCLLDKPEGRVIPVKVDYVGFTIANKFVVGFGLDYKELYRNLPYVGVLKASVYQGGH